jgi:MoxR-like ATPase
MSENTNNNIDVTTSKTKLDALRGELDKTVIGYDEVKELFILCLISRGHIILRAVPGTSKTTLLKAAQKAVSGCQVSRIQLTADLKPSDIIGSPIWDRKTEEFRNVYGPAVMRDGRKVNLLLGDEVNRVPGKTLSALLELAEERRVTMNGQVEHMPELFMLSCTMNPIEMDGTFELPEAFLDRAAVLADMDYVSEEDEIKMLQMITRNKRKHVDLVKEVVSVDELLAICDQVDEVAAAISYAAFQLIVRTVRATRPKDAKFEEVHGKNAEDLRETIAFGGSPRAEIWITYLAAAHALRDGRTTVTPDDIAAVAPHALRHRIILRPAAQMDKNVDTDVIQPTLSRVAVDAL